MIKTANLPQLANKLLATLGHTHTENGDACSPYFTLVLDTRTQAAIAVSLIDERANLPRKEWGYALHVIDDISGAPCEICHDSGNPGTPQEIVQSMLEEVLMDTARIRIDDIRLPTIEEWDRAVKVMNSKGNVLHWENILSWCQDTDSVCPTFHSARGGCYPSDHCHPYYAHRDGRVGFRPVFEGQGFGNIPDGSVFPAAATLFMNGQPVKVPTTPSEGGDIPLWTPGAILEFKTALDIPSYQIPAIKVGDILIADRVLLRNISWEDLEKQGFCRGNMRSEGMEAAMVKRESCPMRHPVNGNCLPAGWRVLLGRQR